MDARVLVVGGGIAGLSCAWALRAGGLEPLLLEAAPHPGGNVRSEQVGPFLLERGPHTFMSSAEGLFQLAEAAGLEQELLCSRPAAHNRLIVRAGQVHPVPTGPSSMLRTGLLSMRGKLRLMAEPFFTGRGRPSDSAATFFTRRFGAEAAHVLAGAFIGGVYAGDPRALNAQAAFPLFWGFEQRAGGLIRGALRYRRKRRGPKRPRGLYSFRRGLGQLTAALADGLGSSCRTGVPVRTIERVPGGYRVHGEAGSWSAPRLVLATPPREAAALLRGLDRELANLLDGIVLAPVAVVHLGYATRRPEIPEAFGFLAPRGEGVRTLGVLFPSRVFDGRAQGDLMTAYVGGMLNPGALEIDDAGLADLVRAELKQLFGLNAEPVLQKVIRHPRAIPQLMAGHLERIAAARERLRGLPGVRLAGNYLSGVGIKDALAAGQAASRALLEEQPEASRCR